MTYLYEVGGEIMRMHDDECPCIICFFNDPKHEGAVIIQAPPLAIDRQNSDAPPKEVL